MRKRSNRVIFSMFIIILSLSGLLIVNIFYASINNVHKRSGEDITKYSQTGQSVSVIKSKRGSIYDSNLNIIAEDITSYNIIAYLDESRVGANNKPFYVVDVDETAKALSSILGGESSFYYNLMYRDEDSKKYQTEFGAKGKGLDLKTKNLIEELELPGIEFVTTSKRHYPLGQFSSHLIGFSDLDSDSQKQVGKMGLELLFNDKLGGIDGKSISTVTINGFKLPNTTEIIQEVEDGHDIYLTLNKNVQYQLEESLKQSLTMDKTDKAWGIVMEAKTGKIIAMSQAPSFDPEVRADIDYLFYPLDYVFEPGSTIKAITYAAALEEGVNLSKTFNSETIYVTYDANGKAQRVSSSANYSDVFKNAYSRNWGIIDYATGFARSSNVGIIELLSNELPASSLEKYLDKFLLFQNTDLDGIKGEAGKKVFKYPSEKLTTAFGQGSTVTSIQMLQAFGAIVNDGIMMKPYIIEQIVNDKDEIIFANSPSELARPISEATSKEMRELMYRVIHDEITTGSSYNIDEIEVIAKTGTAEIVIDGKYSTTRFLSSIASAFPADDPQFVLFYAYESELVGSMDDRSVPINDLVLKVAEEYNLIDHNNNQQTDPLDAIIISEMPNVINHSLDFAKSKLENSKTNVIIIGDGNNVIKQYPDANTKIISNQNIMLYTGDSKIVMPDMTGWSRKEVVAFWNISNASFIIEGFGNVYKQSVPKGVIIDYNSEVRVNLR